MHIIRKIAWKQLIQDKKRMMYTILGNVMVTVLVMLLLLGSKGYQEFRMNLIRREANWEWKCTVQNYEQIEKMQKMDSIEEIAIVQDVGVSQENYSKWENTVTQIYLKMYNSEALQNVHVTLESGRMPQSTDEIIVEKSVWDTLEEKKTIKITINGEKRIYTIVGVIAQNSLDFSNVTFEENGIHILSGGIILFEENACISNLEAYIKVKDWKKVDSTVEMCKQNCDIENVTYNEPLLQYSGRFKTETGEKSQFYILIGVAIFVLVAVVGSLVYSNFNIAVHKRKKEFGTLKSLGATDKQIRRIVLWQTVYCILIAVPIGIILGCLLLPILEQSIHAIVWNIQSVEKEIFTEDTYKTLIEFHISYSVKEIALTVGIVSMMMLGANIVPAIRASKTQPIALIRNQPKKSETNIKALAMPFYIKNTKKIERKLAYKNRKKHKSTYRMLLTSILLYVGIFMMMSTYIAILYAKCDQIENSYMNYYQLYIRNIEKPEEMIEELRKKEIITSAYSYENSNPFYMYVPKEKCGNFGTSHLKEDSYMFTVTLITIDTVTYDAYLKKVGVPNLKENEVILVNTTNEGKKVSLTNYTSGERIEVTDKEKKSIEEEIYMQEILKEMGSASTKEEEKKWDFSIRKVTDIYPEGIKNAFSKQANIYMVVNKATFQKTQKDRMGNIETTEQCYYIKSEDYNRLEKEVEKLKEEYASNGIIVWGMPIQKVAQMEQQKLQMQMMILGIFFMSIAFVLLVHIWNILCNHMQNRKTEFAMFTSIGMTHRQLCNMVCWEKREYMAKLVLWGSIIALLIMTILSLYFQVEMLSILPIVVVPFIVCIISIYFIFSFAMSLHHKPINLENLIAIIKSK